MDVPGLLGGTSFDKGASSSSESLSEADSDVSLPGFRDSDVCMDFAVDKLVALNNKTKYLLQRDSTSGK